jgi:Zn-dependent protease with chaperone function
MKLLLSITPLLLLLIIGFYAFKTPLARVGSFANTTRLWLIQILLVISYPVAQIVLPSDQGVIQRFLNQVDQFYYVRLHVGLLPGLISGTIWLFYFFIIPLVPLLGAIMCYFLSDVLIRRRDRLIPVRKSAGLLREYGEQISFLQKRFNEVLAKHALKLTPTFYVRRMLEPSFYVFGRKRLCVQVVATIGLLHSIRQGSVFEEDIDVMICHEIGHVLNGDLPLVSSIKIFSDLRIIRLAIIATFAALLLIYLVLGVTFCLRYNPGRLGEALSRLSDFGYLLPVFVILYVTYLLLDLLIRTSFKMREFFADARTAQLCSQDVVVNTLQRTKSPFLFLVPKLTPLVPLLDTVLSGRSGRISKMLRRLIPAPEYSRLLNRIEQLIATAGTAFMTHPTSEERKEAIVSRKYLPAGPIFISYKANLATGTALLLASLFLKFTLSLAGIPDPFEVTVFLCSLAALVIINNTHFRLIKHDNLVLLIEGYGLCGIGMTFPEYKRAGRQLFFANQVAVLPFALINSVLWTIGFLKNDVSTIFFLSSLMMPFASIYLFTVFFLLVLTRFNKQAEPRAGQTFRHRLKASLSNVFQLKR